MSPSDIQNEWTDRHVEAYVDGSLEGEQAERMRAAVRADARLRAAVERAAAVLEALRDGARPSLPKGLRRRLLAIPDRPTIHWQWLAVPIAAATAIAGTLMLAPPAPPPPPDPTVAAVRDFELAMHYLRKSALLAQREVTAVVGGELSEAVAISRESVERNRKRENGG